MGPASAARVRGFGTHDAVARDVAAAADHAVRVERDFRGGCAARCLALSRLVGRGGRGGVGADDGIPRDGYVTDALACEVCAGVRAAVH